MTSKSGHRQSVDRRIRQASSAARIEGLEVTEATKSLMIAYADGKVTSEEAIETIIGSYYASRI